MAKKLVVRSKRRVDPDLTLSAAEAKLVQRGEAQAKRGEVKPWSEVKAALRLDSPPRIAKLKTN